MFLEWLAIATVFEVFCLATATVLVGVGAERILASLCQEITRGS
jgi:hypothetical protein